MLSTQHLLTMLLQNSKQAIASRQEEFNLWLTEPKNKENGGTYDWSQVKLAIKRLKKKKSPPTDKEQKEAQLDREEGELEEGEC